MWIYKVCSVLIVVGTGSLCAILGIVVVVRRSLLSIIASC